MSESIVVTLTLQIKPDLVDDFCAGMPATLVETRAFPGYIDVKMYRSADDPNRLIMIEEWESREAYRRYVDWRRGSGAMDGFDALLTAPPQLDFWQARVA